MDKTKEKICHKIILQVTTCHTLFQRSKTQNKRLFFIIRLSFHWLFVTFEPSQLTVKSNEVFFIGFLCSFLFPPEAHERKERSANLPTALLCLFFLNGYPSRPYFGVRGESPIDFLIGKSAVNISAHHQSAILNDLFSCFFSALGNHLKNSLEDVLRPYSVNSLLYILKIQLLIIC